VKGGKGRKGESRKEEGKTVIKGRGVGRGREMEERERERKERSRRRGKGKREASEERRCAVEIFNYFRF